MTDTLPSTNCWPLSYVSSPVVVVEVNQRADCPIKDLATRPFTHRTASGEMGKWCLYAYSCLLCVVRISNGIFSATSLLQVCQQFHTDSPVHYTPSGHGENCTHEVGQYNPHRGSNSSRQISSPMFYRLSYPVRCTYSVNLSSKYEIKFISNVCTSIFKLRVTCVGISKNK